MKTNIFSVVLICIISFSFIGCRHQSNDVENAAQEVAVAFTSGDMKQINAVIFGERELVVDDALKDIWSSDDQKTKSENGILESIFSHDKISVIKINNDTIDYEVEAPNMENVFVDMIQEGQNLSKDELLQYLTDYAANTDARTFSVSVPYSLDGDSVVINYKEENFINAITGGLVDAYRQLYINAAQEYTEGMD